MYDEDGKATFHGASTNADGDEIRGLPATADVDDPEDEDVVKMVVETACENGGGAEERNKNIKPEADRSADKQGEAETAASAKNDASGLFRSVADCVYLVAAVLLTFLAFIIPPWAVMLMNIAMIAGYIIVFNGNDSYFTSGNRYKTSALIFMEILSLAVMIVTAAFADKIVPNLRTNVYDSLFEEVRNICIAYIVFATLASCIGIAVGKKTMSSMITPVAAQGSYMILLSIVDAYVKWEIEKGWTGGSGWFGLIFSVVVISVPSLIYKILCIAAARFFDKR